MIKIPKLLNETTINCITDIAISSSELVLNEVIANAISISYESEKLKELHYDNIETENVEYSSNAILYMSFKLCGIKTYGKNFDINKFVTAINYLLLFYDGYTAEFASYDELMDSLRVKFGVKL